MHNKLTVDTWALIHKAMTPKERREFYKDKKEKTKDYKTDYDWTDLSDNPVKEQ